MMSMLHYFRVKPTLWLIVLGSLSVVLASCGKDGPKLYPVKGKLLYDGKPPEGAAVVFAPVDTTNNLKPSGKVGADGTFTLETYPHGEGAPPGEYNVLVSWYPENARELENAKNQLPEKYRDPSAPLLKATVKEEATELPPMQLDK